MKKHLYVLVVCMVALAGVFWYQKQSSPVSVPPVHAQTPASSEWNQFRGNAQRTGATNQEISGTLTQRWKRGFNEWPHVHAELVVVGNRVYFANMDGKLTVMDADNNGNTVWEKDTGAPINTTPAVVNNRVHVVNLAGRLITYDLSGNKLWEYTVPGNVYSSPAVVGGKIFFGTVDGVFYAFDAVNGGNGPTWTYPVGAMIDTSPCELSGKIIFAAEDMKAYALYTSDGSLAWTAPLTGARSWNAHPLCSVDTNRVFFTPMAEFEAYRQTNREIYDTALYEGVTGPLSDLTAQVDQFMSQDRERLSPSMLLNATNGQRITSFTVAPANTIITSLPFNSWYWGSIRPALWQGDKLYLQSGWRNILIDLRTNRISQPNANQNQTKFFVRGDELVPTTIGGNRAFGGIGENIATLDLTNGSRSNLLGTYGSEGTDFNPLTAPLLGSGLHYYTFPGDGGSGSIGTFVVAGGRAYYEQYGWIYAFDGTITQR